MLVGRELELGILAAHYEKMLAGNGSVLFLTGEAGLGKTTLVHSWWDNELRAEGRGMRDEETIDDANSVSLIPHPSSLFFESACSIPIGNVDVGRLEALQPWADVIAQLQDHESRSTTHEPHKLDLKKLIHEAAPAWAWAIPFVGDIAHAALETSRLVKEQRGEFESPSSAQNQQQVFQQYVNLLTKISAEIPLIIFLDDLHWADTSSCNLLFYLARHIADKKILVICTYRHDDAAQASDGKGHAIVTIKNEILRYEWGREIALELLGRTAIRALLHATFPGYTPDDRFEAWLRKISDGNSLFVTQFVRTLREDGHLSGLGTFVGDYGTVTIPATALAVVEERTRRLDDGTRKLLMYATAEGEEFTTYVLERIAKREPMDLLDELHAAMGMGLISERGTGRLYANKTTGIFGFSHALFHKALYDSLFETQKAHLHQQCYELLKTEWDRLSATKQRTTTLATKLLTHAEKSEEWMAVAEVALDAAKEFWKSFNEEESLAMIGRVIAACDAAHDFDGQRAEALYVRGHINVLRGRYDEAINDYRAAETVFRNARAVERAVEAMSGVAWSFLQTSRYDTALAESSRALSEARAIGYAIGEAGALMNIGSAHVSRGAYDEALAHYESSLAIAVALGNRQGEASALTNIGLVHMHRGAPDEALAYFEKSLAICAAIGNRVGETLALNNIGVVYLKGGAFDEALVHFEKSLAISATTGDSIGEARVLGNVGSVKALRGGYDEALPHFEKSLAISTAIGNRQGEASAFGNIGSVHMERGAYDESLVHYEKSLAINTAIGNRIGEAHALKVMGDILTRKKMLPEARTQLERAFAIATEISALSEIPHITRNLGFLCEAESLQLAGEDRTLKHAEAMRLLSDAIRLGGEQKHDREVDDWQKELERMRNA